MDDYVAVYESLCETGATRMAGAAVNAPLLASIPVVRAALEGIEGVIQGLGGNVTKCTH